MNPPPIASPFGEPSKESALSKRLQWSEEKNCFVFFFKSGLKARLRCEWTNGKHNWYAMLGVLFPLFLPLMLLTQLGKSKAKPDFWEIHSWGIKEDYGFAVSQIRWAEIRRILQKDGDFFVMRVFYKSGLFLTREDFWGMEESHRMERLVRMLQQSDGQSWEDAKQQFRS